MNLMAKQNDGAPDLEQFIFDVEKKTIIGYPHYGVSNRSGLIGMAGRIGDENSRDILWDLAQNHRDPRTRLSAYQALFALGGEDLEASLQKDQHPLVHQAFLRGDFV